MNASSAGGSEALPADPRSRWGSLDLAGRNAAYDNNAAVANSASLIEERNRASAAYRATHPAGLDLPYAPMERTAFDLYPASDPKAPCLIFIHGGYWQRNSREVFACFAEGPAAAGLSVAIPGYSLAPQVTLTGIVAEIKLALDWLARHGPEHGIDGPMVLAGWSAGAQLAALHLAHPHVVAGLVISGIYDLEPLRDTSLNVALNLTNAEIVNLSPLSCSVVRKPLTVVFGGEELPTLVHDARRFYELRCRNGAPGAILPIVGADHFSILHDLRRPEGALVRAAVDLLS